MLEMLLSTGNRGRTYFPESGPGNKFLTSGVEELGYFGTLTGDQLFQGYEITSFVGLTAGSVSKDNNNTWMKFIYKGKFLFICKELTRYNLCWNDLYKAGVMYGVKGPGPYPVAGFSTDQFKVMLKPESGAEVPWKLVPRCLKGASVDPYVGVDYTAFGLAEGNEYNDLIYRLLAPGTNSRPNTGVFEQWTGAQLGAADLGSHTLLQETSASNVANAMTRGATGSTLQVTKATVRASIDGWRPVLELIVGDDYVFDPYQLYQEYTGNTGPISVTGAFVDVVQNPFQVLVTDGGAAVGPNLKSAVIVDAVYPPSALTTVNPLYPVAMTFART